MEELLTTPCRKGWGPGTQELWGQLVTGSVAEEHLPSLAREGKPSSHTWPGYVVGESLPGTGCRSWAAASVPYAWALRDPAALGRCDGGAPQGMESQPKAALSRIPGKGEVSPALGDLGLPTGS